jgi:cyanophycinase
VARSGTLMIIGGHEDKERDALILRDLVRRIGDGKLVVATLASDQPGEMWSTYDRVLRRLGVKHLYHLNIETRDDACSARTLKILEDAAGVFFTGGDQLKITMMLGGTDVASRVREIYEHGGVIAGTSAGASVMCSTMIVHGSDDSSARIGQLVRMSPGLGLIEDVVIDQHFAERGRVPRLIGAIAQNPRILGIGIDENTAIVVERRGRRFRVVGAGAVYAFDAHGMSYANLTEEETDRTLSVFDIRLDMLSQGDSYDLTTRRPTKGPAEEIEQEIEDGVAA